MYKMMIVDDESIVVEGIRDTIPWHKYNIDVGATANNGIEGLDLLETYHPDIVIVDIRMPGIDGLQFIERAKILLPKIQFIIISAFEQFSYAQRAIELGVRFYLVKPIQESDIIEKIKLCIAELEHKSGLNAAEKVSALTAQYIIGCWLAGMHVRPEKRVEAFRQLDFPYENDSYSLAVINFTDAYPYQDILKVMEERLQSLLRHYMLFENGHATIICLFAAEESCDRAENILRSCMPSGLPCKLSMVECGLGECPQQLIRLLAQSSAPSAAGKLLPSGNEYRSHIIRDVCNYMDSKSYLDISLIEVAEHVAISPTYLSALFKQETGVSFIEYLKKNRIERAKSMLTQTNLKVYEICAELGYRSVQYFSTLFKDSVGMTPMEYREIGGKASE